MEHLNISTTAIVDLLKGPLSKRRASTNIYIHPRRPLNNNIPATLIF